jgi:very-short-patch-repair endonuclease
MDVLAALVESGPFTAAAACRSGLGHPELRAAVREGRVARLQRGWYAAPTCDPERLHRLRVAVALGTFAERAIASHQSALVMHGLPLYESPLDRVHLTRTRDCASRRTVGLVIHGRVSGAASVAGVIDAAVAVVQTGLANGPVASLVAADAALHRGTFDRGALTSSIALFARHPGVEAVRTLLGAADPKAESPGETLTRHLLTMLGYRVTSQVNVGAESIECRVDFLLEGEPVVVEFDGATKYTERSVLWAEKKREDRLRDLGFEVVRLTWADVHNPKVVRAKVEAARARARARARRRSPSDPVQPTQPR